ncbi:MAG: polysaccharide pyruvyl transferase family protein, partial [Nitrospirota bacterium]
MESSDRKVDLKHCWITFSQMPEAFNYGNRLIEYSLRKLLKLEGKEHCCINIYNYISKDDIEKINECDFIILPGGTLLQKRECAGMEQLQFVKPLIYCFGGCFNTRLLFPSPKYCKTIVEPIGVRDPFTHWHLRLYGIKSTFIGCPTMFCGDAMAWNNSNDGPIIFNFGRKNIKAQLAIYEEIKRYARVKVVIQDEKQRLYFPNDTDFIEYSDVQSVIDEYANASVVVTGRLHAAIPAIANGTPVVFYQFIRDSRLSLLKFLGIKIYNPYNKK